MDPRDYNVAVISYRDEESDLEFRWHGGAYIDVCGPTGEAFDVLNVWDDEHDRSDFEVAQDHTRIGDYVGPAPGRAFRNILEAFEARCQAWLAELSQDAEV